MQRPGVARSVHRCSSYDPELIGALFADAAEYRYHPWDEPVRGRAAIVASWVEPDGSASGRDQPGTYDARYEPFTVDGDRAVAVGWSRYWTDPSRTRLRDTYRNCFLLVFDRDRQCTSFTELFMREPG